MNNLRHGLRAQTLILPGENREVFDEILVGLLEEYQPQSPSEQSLVQDAAAAQWKIMRAEAYEARQCEKNPDIDARCAIFSHMTLVTGRLQRIYLKFYEKLERIKAARQPQPEPAQAEPSKPSKGKKKDDEQPPNLDVFWVNPETGEKQTLYQRRNGEDVPRSKKESPAPTPQSPDPSPE